MPRRSILCLGGLAADFQIRTEAVPTSAAPVAGREFRRLGGGRGANVALCARRLGHEVRLFGRIGDDDLAEQALAPLQAAGIELAGVRRGGHTPVAMIMVPPDGRKLSAATAEANLEFDQHDIQALESAIAATTPGSVLVVDHEVSPRAASRAIATAHERGLRVVVDPSYPHAVHKTDLRRATALTPNVGEALALTGIKSRNPVALSDAAHALARLGVPLVCIKLDDGGCLVRHGGRSWHQRAAPAKVVDATGAGDAFTAAFALALLEHRDVAEAVRRAVAAAELAVEAYGAQPSYPDRARWEARLALPRECRSWPGEEATD